MSQKPIYGISQKVAPGGEPDCSCTVDPSIESSLGLLLTLLTKMRANIEKYFPVAEVNLGLTGRMNLTMKVPPVMMVRLIWRDRNPTAKQDRYDPFYLNALRDIYLEYMWDPMTDPLLNGSV